jgi:hypothetical protein
VQIHRSLWVSVLAYHTDTCCGYLPFWCATYSITSMTGDKEMLLYSSSRIILWFTKLAKLFVFLYCDTAPAMKYGIFLILLSNILNHNLLKSMKYVCYLCHAVSNSKHGDRFWFRWRFMLMHVYDNGMKCHWTLDQW